MPPPPLASSRCSVGCRLVQPGSASSWPLWVARSPSAGVCGGSEVRPDWTGCAPVGRSLDTVGCRPELVPRRPRVRSRHAQPANGSPRRGRRLLLPTPDHQGRPSWTVKTPQPWPTISAWPVDGLSSSRWPACLERCLVWPTWPRPSPATNPLLELCWNRHRPRQEAPAPAGSARSPRSPPLRRASCAPTRWHSAPPNCWATTCRPTSCGTTPRSRYFPTAWRWTSAIWPTIRRRHRLERRRWSTAT